METKTLEQVVKQYVHLPTITELGWSPVIHTTCDRGHKGPRAGWQFDNGTVAFHCFNCSLSSSYIPTKHKTMPKNMIQALRDFGVPEDEWQAVVFHNMEAQESTTSGITPPAQSIEPPEIKTPSQFYYLKDANPTNSWAMIANAYLEDRNIDPLSYPFMLSKFTKIPIERKWLGRVIIPIYKQDKLIFYTGRDLTGAAIKKYETPSVSRERVICGFEQLFVHANLPLYITEGWFDAYVIEGVAILGNEMSTSQIEWLTRSPRKKVYVPDRTGNGQIAAKLALKLGWEIAIPDTPNCKDISDAVQKYGKLYVLKSLRDHTFSGFEAEINLKVHIK